MSNEPTPLVGWYCRTHGWICDTFASAFVACRCGNRGWTSKQKGSPTTRRGGGGRTPQTASR